MSEHGPSRSCASALEHEPHTWDAPDMNKVWCPGLKIVGRVSASEAGGEKKAELGPVGKVVVSVVALAILTPFIGILWALAMHWMRMIGSW